MKKILYIGNNLNKKTANISGIQVLGSLLKAEGFEVFFASSHNNKFRRLLDMIYSCLKYRKQVDFVLIDTYSTQNFYYALIIGIICQWFQLKYFPILHGGNLPSRLDKSPRMSKILFGAAAQNIAPSVYIKDAFNKRDFKNVTHIPNTLEIDNYPIVSKHYDDVKLLWVRSFSKIYNPALAIKVLYEVQKTYPNSSLCMIGPDADGSLISAKRLAEELNVNVEFTGKLEKKDWIERSIRQNIFINTTNFDNMPVSVMEAMALGFPIVSTNVGGLPSLIEDRIDGVLVEPNDPIAMAQAIDSIVSNAEFRTNLSKNARQKVEQLDWAVIKSRWIDLFESYS